MGKIRSVYDTLFIERTNHGLIQLFRYGFVGGFSAFVDMGTLFICTDFLNVHYLVSAGLAFILGTIVNYVLSIAWVFQSSSNKKIEFMLFSLIGLGGLGLNELIIWIAVSKFGVFYLLSKLISVSIVLFWSFSLRKLLFSRLLKQQLVNA